MWGQQVPRLPLGSWEVGSGAADVEWGVCIRFDHSHVDAASQAGGPVQQSEEGLTYKPHRSLKLSFLIFKMG